VCGADRPVTRRRRRSHDDGSATSSAFTPPTPLAVRPARCGRLAFFMTWPITAGPVLPIPACAAAPRPARARRARRRRAAAAGSAPGSALRAQQGRQIAEAPVQEAHAIAEALEPRRGQRQGAGVAIEPDDVRARHLDGVHRRQRHPQSGLDQLVARLHRRGEVSAQAFLEGAHASFPLSLVGRIRGAAVVSGELAGSLPARR
jgi:hypothetical protein